MAIDLALIEQETDVNFLVLVANAAEERIAKLLGLCSCCRGTGKDKNDLNLNCYVCDGSGKHSDERRLLKEAQVSQAVHDKDNKGRRQVG